MHARQTFVVLKHTPRAFVAQLPFVSTAGFLGGSGARARSGAPGAGPQVVITDLGLLRPAPDSEELTLVARYENTSVEQARAATGWPLRVAETVEVLPPPTAAELRVLRDLHKRTRRAHARAVVLPAGP